MKFIPHSYQDQTIKRLVASKELALFQDPGLGKTVQVLSAIQQIKEKTLLVAPLEVCYRVWPKEIKKWDHTQNIRYTILHGPNKERNLLQNRAIYIINPEGLKWLYKACERLRLWHFRVLVIDESTIFKSATSKSFALLAEMLPAFDRRYILTGTPMTKSYLDLWSQYYILDLGERLTDNFYHYRQAHFYQSDYKGYQWDLFPGREKVIEKIVADITVRIDGSKHLDLPEIIVNDVIVSIPDEAREHYKIMLKHLITEFDDGKIVKAANAAVKTGKLQCISNGFLYISEKDRETGKTKVVDTKVLHRAKIDALKTLVEELNGNPLIVGYHFKQDLVMLQKTFPKAPAFASGMERAAKQRIENQWNAGKIPLLFAQIHASARGLNLQDSGYHVAYYSLIWNAEDYGQFILRVARQGQKSKRVFVHRLIAQKTIDELMIQVLDNRLKMSKDFLDSVYSHAQEMINEN